MINETVGGMKQVPSEKMWGGGITEYKHHHQGCLGIYYPISPLNI